MSTWPKVALGEIFDIARGGSPRPIQNFLTEDSEGVNWIMIGDASDTSKYIQSTKKRIKKEGVKRSRMVHPGDFLLTNSMSFGHPYIMKTSGCIHDGWLVLSVKNDNVDQNYFYYLLGSNNVYREFASRASGTTVKNLNINIVKSVKVTLPPIEEQQRIAEILDKADAIRRKRKEAIRLTESLLRSAFLDMFGDPVTNPKGWETTDFKSQISEMRYGTSVKCHEVQSAEDLPVLRIPNIIGEQISWQDLKFVSLDDKNIQKLSLRSDDLLFQDLRKGDSCALVQMS